MSIRGRFVGTVLEFPKRKDAEKAIAQLRVEVNEGAQYAPHEHRAACRSLQEGIELPRKAYSTIESYTDFLDSHIVPKWGRVLTVRHQEH